MQNPRTLHQAYKLTRLQEVVFEAQAQSWGFKMPGLLPKPSFQPSTNTPVVKKNVGSNQGTSQMIPPNVANKFPGKRLSAAEMNEKRAKGLRFFL